MTATPIEDIGIAAGIIDVRQLDKSAGLNSCIATGVLLLDIPIYSGVEIFQ